MDFTAHLADSLVSLSHPLLGLEQHAAQAKQPPQWDVFLLGPNSLQRCPGWDITANSDVAGRPVESTLQPLSYVLLALTPAATLESTAPRPLPHDFVHTAEHEPQHVGFAHVATGAVDQLLLVELLEPSFEGGEDVDIEWLQRASHGARYHVEEDAIPRCRGCCGFRCVHWAAVHT